MENILFYFLVRFSFPTFKNSFQKKKKKKAKFQMFYYAFAEEQQQSTMKIGNLVILKLTFENFSEISKTK